MNDPRRGLAIGVFVSLSVCTFVYAHDPVVSVSFVPNGGQTDSRVAFDAKVPAGTAFVTRRGELVYSLRGPAGGWSLSETFVGGRPLPTSGDRAPARVSYLASGDAGRSRESLPTYASVRFVDVWEGIGVSLRLNAGSFEKLFTVAPGVSPDAIRMQVRGAESLCVDHDGSLVAVTGIGEVSFSAPLAFQERRGERIAVAAAYVLNGHEYGFQIGAHDSALPLVIDPILQSTYLGSSAFEGSAGIGVHPTTGDVYVTGITQSANFPGVAGGAQPTLAGSNDAYVARLNSTLTSLIQATFFGGSGLDNPTGIALHPADGSVYIAGYTDSLSLPGTAGAPQPAAAGLGDAFVARLSPSLTTLHRSTFLGGSFTDRAFAIRIHPASGEVYVTGDTLSVDFPGRAGGAQPIHSGSSDAFVSRLDPPLATILQSTYFGGGLSIRRRIWRSAREAERFSSPGSLPEASPEPPAERSLCLEAPPGIRTPSSPGSPPASPVWDKRPISAAPPSTSATRSPWTR